MNSRTTDRFTGGRRGRGEESVVEISAISAPSCMIWFLSVFAVALVSPFANAQKGPPPGVVISSSPDPDRAYVGTPAIVILPDGRYVAAHDFFGKNEALT